MEIEDTHYHTSGNAHYFSAIAHVHTAEMVAAQIGGDDALEDNFRRLELQCLLHANRKLPGVEAFSVSFERDRKPADSFKGVGVLSQLDQITVDMTYTRTTDYYPKGDKCDNYK